MEPSGVQNTAIQSVNDDLKQLVLNLQALIQVLRDQTPQNTMPELLTVEEVARLTKFNKRSISRMRINGEIPEPDQVGKSPRWQSTVIINWMANGCPKNDS